MRVGLDTSDHDAAARILDEHVAGDRDAVDTETDARRVRVGVVADAQAELAQVDEPVANERDVLGGRNLHRPRHLVPDGTGRLERWIVAARDERAGLLAGVAVGAAGSEP